MIPLSAARGSVCNKGSRWQIASAALVLGVRRQGGQLVLSPSCLTGDAPPHLHLFLPFEYLFAARLWPVKTALCRKDRSRIGVREKSAHFFLFERPTDSAHKIAAPSATHTAV